MEIHLYTLCWNDADILPFFFTHYDYFVSRYFIFDDCSIDGSLDLLHSHPNVEVKPFVRSDPDSFTLSELSISDECWKRSRGFADWVIVIDIDEHLFHPDLPVLLRRYQAFGITIVPALGYQMISEEFPRSDALLCQTCTQGAPWDIYSKLTFFDPAAITDSNYSGGRHAASPTGRVIAPARDELLLLHYKFLGFERTLARHRRQRSGLRSKDIDNGWGYQYGWSEEELRRAWDGFAGKVIDVRTDAAVANYPIPRWWDPFRSLATPPRVQAPNIHRQIEEELKQGGYPVARQTVVSDVVAATSSVSFWIPDYFCPSAWIEHAPFAFWLCEALRPRRFVELGTHYGYSYFAFCQAINRLGLGTAAYAVDTWKGDEHAGFYDESVFQSVVTQNNDKYSAFSTLICSTFEGALNYFADGSVDLLHIDGRHFYDDIDHDFTLWRPKLTEDAVVLLHDTNEREREFGVWKFFERAAAQHPSFQFLHGHGLGVLVPGDRVPAPLAPLLETSQEIAHRIRAAYAALGGALGERHRQIEAQNAKHAQSLGEIEALKARIATTVSERDEALAALAEEREALVLSRASLAETQRSTGFLQATLGERDAVLGEISRRAEELVGTLQTTQSELSKRDDALSHVEAALSDQRIAAEAMQAENATLRDSLIVGREVGKAALAAMRTDLATGPGYGLGDTRLPGRWGRFRGWGCRNIRKRAKPSVITLADRARDAGQWELAVTYYRIAVRRKPKNPPIWVQYGHVLKQSGELAEAERAYRTAVAYDQSVADSHLQLGHVLKLQGKKEEARAAYLRAFALDRSLEGASFELSQLGWSEAHFSGLRGMLGTLTSVNSTSPKDSAVPAAQDKPAGTRQNDFTSHYSPESGVSRRCQDNELVGQGSRR
jgi:tetratricopeptide (TPR) repeat protein